MIFRKIIVLALIFMSASPYAMGQAKDSPRFNISIVQNGKVYPVSNNVIRLKKQPFAFLINMNKSVVLCVGADFESTNYAKVQSGLSSDKLTGFEDGDAMAWTLKNIDKDIGVTGNSFNAWYFESDSINSFESVKEVSGMLECKIQIEKLSVVPPSSDIVEIPIEKVDHDLYLVFVDRESTDDGFNDLYKVTCKIEWE